MWLRHFQAAELRFRILCTSVKMASHILVLILFWICDFLDVTFWIHPSNDEQGRDPGLPRSVRRARRSWPRPDWSWHLWLVHASRWQP